jgi:sugar/nucleoside kinase (ribokinase family)
MDLAEPSSPDVAVVGHFSIDTIMLPSRPHSFVVLGGSVTYVSLVTRRLEGNASIISKVGGDFPEAYVWLLREEGIDISAVARLENEQTTRFELQYSGDLSDRTLRLKSRAPAIGLDDLPYSMRAKAIHLAPIAGEVSVEVAERLKHNADRLSLDPQGLLRSFSVTGTVSCCASMDKSLLDLVDVYKSSLDEIKVLTGQKDLKSAIKSVHDHGVETVLITLGAKGAVLSVEKTVYNVPAYVSKRVVDPTGAGDVFIGGFLTEYVRAKDSLWCACVGSAAASLVVEGLGPTYFGEKEEIYQRAESIYGKEIKQ